MVKVKESTHLYDETALVWAQAVWFTALMFVVVVGTCFYVWHVRLTSLAVLGIGVLAVSAIFVKPGASLYILTLVHDVDGTARINDLKRIKASGQTWLRYGTTPIGWIAFLLRWIWRRSTRVSTASAPASD